MTRPAHDEEASKRAFVDAVTRGDADGLRALFERDPAARGKVNERLFAFDAPAIVFVAGRNDRAIMDALLDAGADPAAKSGWWAGGFAALHSVSDPALAEHLVSRGAPVDVHAAAHLGWMDRLRAMVDRTPALVHARGGDGQTPLHVARTAEVAEYLLGRGAEIDARDVDHGSTPAQYAVGGRHDVARYLMARGATPDVFMAAAVGEMDYLRNALLGDPTLLRARTDDKTFPGPPGGGGHIYRYVLDHDTTLLHAAARHDRTAVAEFLVAVGLDVNARGGYDDATPLHSAAWHNRPATAATLIDLGADVEAESGPIHKNTPLGWAIVAGAVDVADLLLSRGATLRDYYLPNAQQGEAGAFAAYARPPAGAYGRIIERLRRAGA